MQLGHFTTRGRDIRRGAFALILVVFLLAPRSAPAETIGLAGLMGNQAFVALAIAIGNVNRAMRDAAENPMDKWRRQNVRSAISALPAAIIGLANEFKAGKLHDADLPTVQGILGGFVDVNAADAYQKFLQNPSKDLIPELGNDFPRQYAQGGGGSGPSGAVASNNTGEFDGQLGAPGGRGPSIGFDDNAERPAPNSGAGDPGTGYKEQAVASAESRARELDSISVGFDDSAKKGATKPFEALESDDSDSSTESVGDALTAALGTGGSGSSSSSEVSEQFTLTEDPLSVRPRRSGVVIRRANPSTENALEGDFFGKVQKGQQALEAEEEAEENPPMLRRLQGKGRTSAADPKNYRLQVQPKYWKMTSFLRLTESLVFTPGLAQGGQCAGGQCGGGEGGGGGGGGEAAAQVLFGVAAIISAISPMVVAGIQASADKAIARTNAAAQITMTQITSNTSKFLSNQQKEIALTQTAAAQQIAAQNNTGVTQRLNMQLAELRQAREDQARREREKIAIEQELNKQRIDLANKQAEDNLLLAKQTLNAQLTQAGLSTGFSNSRNSGNRLTVGRTNTAVRSGDTVASGSTGDVISGGGATAGGGTALGFRSTGSNGTQIASAGNVATGGSLGLSNRSIGAKGKPQAKPQTAAAAGRNRLLNSATGKAFYSSNGEKLVYDEQEGEWVTQAELVARLKKRKKGNASPVLASASGSSSSVSRGGIASRKSGRGASTLNRQLSAHMMGSHSLVRGSSPDNKISSQRPESARVLATSESNTSSSDLGTYIQSARPSDSFADFQNAEAQRRTANVAGKPTPSGGHSPGGTGRGVQRGGRGVTNAYNPPSSGYSTAIGK